MGGEISYMHLLARVLSPLLQPHHAPNCLTALFHLGLVAHARSGSTGSTAVRNAGETVTQPA